MHEGHVTSNQIVQIHHFFTYFFDVFIYLFNYKTHNYIHYFLPQANHIIAYNRGSMLPISPRGLHAETVHVTVLDKSYVVLA